LYSAVGSGPKFFARIAADPERKSRAEQDHDVLAEIIELKDAVDRYLQDGDTVALEGFTHLIPFAAGHEIIRQRRRGLTLVRLTPDLVYDQMIGAGCAAGVTFSWGGNPGVGSLHRLRDAVENDWPNPVKIEEHSHAGMTTRYAAGASGLPFGVLRGYVGTDLPKYNPNIRFIDCPFTGETLAAVPGLRLDMAIIHAQKADRNGNVLIWGVVGVQKEAILCARRAIVTVEEIVDDLNAPPNAVVLPSWVISAVAVVPGGSFPSYAQGYYDRSNTFYKDWDAIARDRETFTAWIDRHIHGTRDFDEFRRSLREAKHSR
jgi:glutaconate CoA-transferase subunit A